MSTNQCRHPRHKGFTSFSNAPSILEMSKHWRCRSDTALYEPGAVLVAGGKPVTGHDGIRDALNVFLSSGARMKLDTRAVVESGEGLAVLHGAWSLGPPSTTQGLSTEVVRRQPDGSWMFVIDNPNTPR